MKNINKLDSLMEEISCEPRSPDYDSALSSMLQIDSKAHEIAKGYGVPVGQIYKAIDFNPKGFVSEFGANQEGLEFSHSDVMRDLQVLEKQIVSKEDRQYGGIGLPEFLDNEDALFGYFEKPKLKPAGADGEVVKRKEIVLKEEMGFFDKVAKFAGEHPYMSAGVLIGSLFGITFAANAYQSNKKAVDNYVNSGIAKAKAEISAGASGLFFGDFFKSAPPVSIDKIVPANDTMKAANASAVATPQVSETPQPNYDYYDSDFKVGIVIEKYKEDPLFPNNVTRMLEVMSEKTPKRYEEAMNAFKQTPKKIVKSYYNYNYNSEREIGLDKITVELGGSDKIKNVLNADGSLYAEMIASAPLKEPLKNRYEGELYQHSNGMKYRVDAGIWTKENANKWLKEGRWFEIIEGRLPTQEDKEDVDIEKYLIQ